MVALEEHWTIARRVCGLSARAFGQHTPRELREMVDGAVWREQRGEDQLAWQTAHLMNATGNYKSEVTPEALLGRDLIPADPLGRTAAEAPVDPEAADRIMRAKALLAQAQIKAAAADGRSRVEDVTPPEVAP